MLSWYYKYVGSASPISWANSKVCPWRFWSDIAQPPRPMKSSEPLHWSMHLDGNSTWNIVTLTTTQKIPSLPCDHKSIYDQFVYLGDAFNYMSSPHTTKSFYYDIIPVHTPMKKFISIKYLDRWNFYLSPMK